MVEPAVDENEIATVRQHGIEQSWLKRGLGVEADPAIQICGLGDLDGRSVNIYSDRLAPVAVDDMEEMSAGAAAGIEDQIPRADLYKRSGEPDHVHCIIDRSVQEKLISRGLGSLL
jgi:hypothetical protein